MDWGKMGSSRMNGLPQREEEKESGEASTGRRRERLR
jgi:hypothetical protein